MLVRFLKVWRMYQPGETAGFDADMVQALTSQGFAELVEDKPDAKPKKEAKT